MMHMLKSCVGLHRGQREAVTRCGLILKLEQGQHLPDVGVTGSDQRVTCPECNPERTPE